MIVVLFFFAILPVLCWGIFRTQTVFLQIPFFIIAVASSEFFKRFIYSYSETSSLVYFAIILFPDLIFWGIILSHYKSLTKRFLIPFLGVGLFFSIIGFFQNPAVNIIANWKIMYFYVLLCGISFKCFLPSDSEIQHFFFLFFPLVLFAGMYGIAQFSFGYFPWEMDWLEKSPTQMGLAGLTNQTRVFRAFSVFSGLHDFALFLTYSLLYLWFCPPFFLKKFFRLSLLLFLLVALFCSGSKGVWLALVTSLFLFRTRLVFSKAFVAICFSSIFLVFYAFDTAIFYSYLTPFLEKTGKLGHILSPESIVPRVQIFLAFFSDQLSWDFTLILGHGMGSTIGPQGPTLVFDSMYLMILYEFGILGLFLFFSIILKTVEFLQLISSQVSSNSQSNLGKLSGIFLIVVFFDCLGSQTLVSKLPMVLFCFSFTQLFSIAKSSFPQEKPC